MGNMGCLTRHDCLNCLDLVAFTFSSYFRATKATARRVNGYILPGQAIRAMNLLASEIDIREPSGGSRD